MKTANLHMPHVSNAEKVKAYLQFCGYKPKDVAAFAGNSPSTVRAVLCGSSISRPIRKATLALLNLNNPAIAKEVEALWPEGQRLAA